MIIWLLHGLIDFDYICESLLPELNEEQSGQQFRVGAMAYDAVVVPPMRTLRQTTLDRLEAFAAAGGKLIFAGEVPSLVDAIPSERPGELARRTRHVEFSSAKVLEAVEDQRELDVRLERGGRAGRLVHQIRDDGEVRYLFVCNTAREAGLGPVTVRIRGEWGVTDLDTGSGRETRIQTTIADGWTTVDWACFAHAHLLLKLDSDTQADGEPVVLDPVGPNYIEKATVALLKDPAPVTLSEPNVLLLDQAEWRLNGGDWQAKEEILRLDDRVRDALELPRRGGQMAQPWTAPDDREVLAELELRFSVVCDVPVTAPSLAMEEPEATTIFVDGQPVDNRDCGWWVDEAIRTIALPDLAVGTHELVLRIAYHRKINIEWCYLLGDFGVDLAGTHSRITKPVRRLAFDGWAGQGLPFYTGNVTYHCGLDAAEEAHMKLRIPHFAGALIAVKLDGEVKPDIAFAPFESDLGTVSAGSHELQITLFGNRRSAFGALHWAVPASWVGPQAWRTRGDDWCYEYNLRPVGIMSAPRILKG